jgi:cell division protein YceG involved in septum cleavage
MELEKIMQLLSKGTYQVVIPEGSTVQEIAEILSLHGVPKEAFFRAVNNTRYPFSFVKKFPRNSVLIV